MSKMIVTLLLALAVKLAVAPSAVAESVRFPSASTPPTPLQERLARDRGQPIARAPLTELTGEFYRPVGAGPFPAVIALHGCAGPLSRERADSAGATYAALGYVLLLIDSYGPRAITQRCLIEQGAPPDRLMDAYGGLLYLAALPFIDPDRIAVIGYSQGGDIALEAVKLGGVETQFDRRFRAAIAYYPYCETSSGSVSVPTLILIGELDEATPARNCREMMARRSGQGANVRLVVYPGAHHAFNSVRLRNGPETAYGKRNEYNEPAARAAWDEELAALHDAFRGNR